MARTISIIGNDGSGKSTFAQRYATRLTAAGVRVVRRPYYDSIVRSLLRRPVERLAGVSGRKMGREHSESDPARRDEGRSAISYRRGPQAGLLLALLWVYQLCMAAESRVRDLLCLDGVLLQDRSFVDDLASTLEILRLRTPRRLVKWSARLFPIRRAIYVRAGHEVEYARIVKLDLSPQMHKRKSKRYDTMVELLETAGIPVRRINTAPRGIAPSAAPPTQVENT